MKEQGKTVELESSGRRKAVKTIVGGVTVVAAYNFLPAKWGVPVVESIFVPAHGATSGTIVGDPCSVIIASGDQSTPVAFTVTGFVTPAVSGLPVNIEITTTGGGNAGVSQYPSTLTGLVTDTNGRFSLDLGQWAVGTQRIDAVTRVEGASGEGRCHANVPAAQSSCCGTTGTITIQGGDAGVQWTRCDATIGSYMATSGDIILNNVDITQDIVLTIGTGGIVPLSQNNVTFIRVGVTNVWLGTVLTCGPFSVTIDLN